MDIELGGRAHGASDEGAIRALDADPEGRARALPAAAEMTPPGADHETTPLLVWVDIDRGIAPLVEVMQRVAGVRTLWSCQGGGSGPAGQAYVSFISRTETEEDTLALCRHFVAVLARERQAARKAGNRFDCRIDCRWHPMENVTGEIRILTVDPWREAAIARVTAAIAASLATDDGGRAP
jgi:hypothetical protein